MGGSAGAIGTEANCDFFAEQLHSINPGRNKFIFVMPYPDPYII